jgi:hypothetical protein
VLAEFDLYEPLLGSHLGDRRDAIGRTGGMEGIIEQNDSFRFSRICGKIALKFPVGLVLRQG